jgi:tRNA(adenine34) deaminase
MKDEAYMGLSLEEAIKAFESEEVPVGAIVVSPEGKVLSRAYNQTIRRNSPVAHAEILAIEKACKAIGNYRLTGCRLFVTKEPCIMCAGAIIEARLGEVVFGCFDTKRGAFGSAGDVNSLPSNHKVLVVGNVMADQARSLLQEFFRVRRDTEVVITGPTRNRLSA